MFKCGKKLIKKTKGACSSPISMARPSCLNGVGKEVKLEKLVLQDQVVWATREGVG